MIAFFMLLEHGDPWIQDRYDLHLGSSVIIVSFQNSVPLKALFPQSPQSLLMPLLTLPSGQCVSVRVGVSLVHFTLSQSTKPSTEEK